MQRLSLILSVGLAAVALLGQPDTARPRDTTDDESIGRIAEAWMDTYNGGNAAKVAALYTVDGYYLSAHILAHAERRFRPIGSAGLSRVATLTSSNRSPSIDREY